MTTKVLVLGGGFYRSLWDDTDGEFISVDADAKTFDLICFTGGTDINPAIYAEKSIRQTDIPDRERDEHEIRMFNRALEAGIPMVGICRGAQLLCALSGGSLIQHVTGHLGAHMAKTADGQEMLVTSSHHQMMYPVDTFHKVLMSADNRSAVYLTGDGDIEPEVDYEVVYFKDTRALAHQPHPEWMERSSEYRMYFFETVRALLNNKL